MKNQTLITILFILTVFVPVKIYAQHSATLSVENTIKKKGKYAILVQNEPHFMASVMTGEEYKAKSKSIQFEIVLIGSIVKDLAEKETLKPFIEKARNSGIKIVVCEFAMEKLGVKKSQYPSSVLTTPNGFTYIFGLQESGFKTITL